MYRPVPRSRAPLALGIAVVGGMLFSTILTFFVVPATYIALERLRQSLVRRPTAADPSARAA